MKESDNQYLKRIQKDYSMSFKLSAVKEVARGFISKRESCENKGFKVTEQ
jgi:hypothetical protein